VVWVSVLRRKTQMGVETLGVDARFQCASSGAGIGGMRGGAKSCGGRLRGMGRRGLLLV
jgi:hypothetical protein